MQNKSNFINELDNLYFWDVDISKIDPHESRRLIIERVFSLFGKVEDIRAIIDYYGAEEVAKQLAGLPYLDPKTLSFASVILDKPKEEFRCYTKKPSPHKFWNS
jgi:hypothetical protein